MYRLLLLIPLLTGCITTIDLPLQSQHVMRPRANTDPGLYLQMGALETPDMTNTLPEVRDARGNVTNPTNEKQLFGSSMETESYVDAGFETDQNLVLGVSSGRGYYLIYDYFAEGDLTLSGTVSYAYRTDRTSETNQYIGEAEGVRTIKIGRQTTSSLAQMVSYKYAFDEDIVFFPYASLGVNYARSILKANSDKAEKTDILPSLVAGLYVKLGWFQVDLEEGIVFGYKERDEKARAQASHARAFGLSFTF